MKVAYWDTELGHQPPAALGQIQGTPTIRAFKPNPAKGNKKTALDYNSAREAKDMLAFAVSNMPSLVERVDGVPALDALIRRAKEVGAAVALVFSKSGGTSSSLKTLSVEMRGKVVVGELKQSKANAAAAARYGVTKWPSVVGLVDGESVPFEKEPTYNRLSAFFGKLARQKRQRQKEEL